MTEVKLRDIDRIIFVVKEKMGYDFSAYALASFKRRIERMLELKMASSVDDLLLKIEDETISNEQFLKELTVSVTEMFRDPTCWKVLKKMIQLKLERQERIRIWHAGCASGEEVYSMLILLYELNALDRVDIMASDIDFDSIRRARSGMINRRSIDQNRLNYLTYNPHGEMDSHLEQVGSTHYAFNSDLLSKVHFVVSDLTNSFPVPSCDFIFCRNVMIYFSQKLQNQVLDLFLRSLTIDSYLILGAKESMAWCENSTHFMSCQGQESVYRKIKL